MKQQFGFHGGPVRCGRVTFRVVAASVAFFVVLFSTTAGAQQAPAPERPAAATGAPRVAQPAGPGAGGVAAVLPTTSLTATQCAQQGGSCDASGSCVKFVLNPDGGFRPVVLGTCGSGSGGDGPTPGGGGGNPGPAFENHCVNGINNVDYGGIAFNCGAEGDRCRAACRNASSTTIRKKCNDACFQVNLNCCTGKDPIRAQCNGTIDATRRSRCNADRVARDNRCGTDPGTFPGSTLPRSIQDCLQASRLREGDCCSGIVEPEG